MRRRILALVVWAMPLAAQTSALQGLITDHQGAVIAAGAVPVTNLETAAARQTISGPDGGYRFLQLPPGNYRIEVQNPGFRTHTQDIRLQVNTPVTLDIKLEVGPVIETVNVTAEACRGRICSS